LTNVLRHAGAASTSVSINASVDGALVVEVDDDGPGGVDAAGTGVGIRGMRERAQSTGGTLAAGRRNGGGFAVRATWPARS
jgi:signal transduction histidine kinase